MDTEEYFENTTLALDALVEGVNDLKDQMTALIMAVQLQTRKKEEKE